MPFKLSTLTGFGFAAEATPIAAPPAELSFLTKNPPLTLEKPLMWAAGAHIVTRKIQPYLLTMPFWEGTGAANSLNQDYIGTLVGNPTWIDTELGLGVDFDGSASGIDLDNTNFINHLLKPQFPHSIEIIFSLDTTGEFPTMWTNDAKTSNYTGINIDFRNASNSLYLLYGNDTSASSSGRRTHYGTTTSLVTNTLYHGIIVATNITTISMWVDGVPQSITTSGSAATLVYTANPVSFGRQGRAGNVDLNGQIIFFSLANFKYTNDYVDYRFRNPFASLILP